MAGKRVPGTGAVSGLLSLANRDAGLAALAAGAEGSVAVGEAAQPFVLAAVARHGRRRPLVVAVPSGTTAERLAHEMSAWVGPARSPSSRPGRRCPSSG